MNHAAGMIEAPHAAPPLTTTAGRHAADRRRALHDAGPFDPQQVVRNSLETAFRNHGLPTFAHLQPEPGIEPSLAVRCRVDSCARDHDLIYALLDEQGWRTSTSRLSRMNARNERLRLVRLVHGFTGATLVLIVTLPVGLGERWDVA